MHELFHPLPSDLLPGLRSSHAFNFPDKSYTTSDPVLGGSEPRGEVHQP